MCGSADFDNEGDRPHLSGHAPLPHLYALSRSWEPERRTRLTPRGRKLFNEMARQHEEWIVQAFSSLTDKDLATLYRLLGKVKEHALDSGQQPQ